MIRAQFALLWKFLGFFQKPFTRTLHAAIVVLVAMQLLGGLGVTTIMIDYSFIDGLPLWGHAANGTLILTLALVLTAHSFYRRGLAHFFPYLFGNMTQLRSDVVDSLHFKIIGPRPGGLASSVQGLGLGALLFTALSGAAWLLLACTDSPLAGISIDFHPVAATLLTIYLAVHGAMALLHFTVWQKKMQKQK